MYINLFCCYSLPYACKIVLALQFEKSSLSGSELSSKWPDSFLASSALGAFGI